MARRDERGVAFGCVGCGGSLFATIVLTLALNLILRACG